MTITFRGNEFKNACEAMQHAGVEGGKSITLAGRYFVVAEEEADRLAANGVSFAYLCDHVMPDGTYRLMTVPVN